MYIIKFTVKVCCDVLQKDRVARISSVTQFELEDVVSCNCLTCMLDSKAWISPRVASRTCKISNVQESWLVDLEPDANVNRTV